MGLAYVAIRYQFLPDLPCNSPWVCFIKDSSNGSAAYIIGPIIAKGNVNIANLIQTFEICFSENTQQNFLILLYTKSPWVHVIKFVQMVVPPALWFV